MPGVVHQDIHIGIDIPPSEVFDEPETVGHLFTGMGCNRFFIVGLYRHTGQQVVRHVETGKGVRTRNFAVALAETADKIMMLRFFHILEMSLGINETGAG